ncbi:Protein of unknown function [Singulisphaera sp. GP187]|uniref:DUF551 domain-containing protein n=1 Tax=Singulisphaera sp. GP187 TaxID=1882752 RepID=UPI0009262955|nr:DUF551 domain-containing protein [Singulisphaera sp. GP187]SIN69444.1 Protein of unknown function [Singulisphaera sp. GP187]
MTWTSVNEVLPVAVDGDFSEPVLVWPRAQAGSVYQRLGIYNHRNRVWVDESGDYRLSLSVTHWMLMPEGPT